jgi:DNA-binding IclR family transcriptional regulator
MHRSTTPLLAAYKPEVEAVLAALAALGLESSCRLNDLGAATGLPPGHVGRHLRTLERERMVRYASGAWGPTQRGVDHAADIASDLFGAAA